MRLRLTQAFIDDLKIHDVADLANTAIALRTSRRVVDVRRNVRDRANRHGVVDESKFYGGQTIDLSGYCDSNLGAAATEDAYDELRAKVALPGDHVFRFRRKGRTEDEQIVFRQVAGFEAPQEGDRETILWSGSLFSADPRVYTAAAKGTSYDPTVALAGGGAPIPLVFPIVFASTTVTLLVVTNAGTFPTPPLFTIKGPVIDPIIDNVDTGESIVIVGNYGVNDTIVVDVALRTVLLNGVSRRDIRSSSLSKWFNLNRGTTRLRLRGNGTSAGFTSLAVTYRDARI